MFHILPLFILQMSQTIRGDEEFAKLLHNRGGKWGARYDWQNKARLIDLLITAHYYKNSVRKITVKLVEQKKLENLQTN